MIKGVIFDLDGTLLNTLADLTNITNKTLEEFGYPPRSMEEVEWYVGNGARPLIQRALPDDLKLSEEEFEKIYEVMLGNYAKYQNIYATVYDGMEEVLLEMKARGIRTAIVTNKPHSAAEDILHKYFEGLIEMSQGAQDGVPKKPDPALCNLVLEAFGLSPEECIYVGDSDTDIDTAKNAGLLSVSVTWGFRRKQFLIEHGAEHFAEKPEELLRYLD